MSNQPPYGAPQQYGMPQPPGQQPKKSNAALIAAVVALVIAVAAVTVTLVIVLDKDDDSDSSSGSDSSSSSSPSSDSTPSSSDPSSQPTDPTSDAPDLSGEQVQGTGYTYRLPPGWREDTEAFGSGFDTGSLREAPDGTRTNLLVQRGEATDSTDLEASRDSWQDSLTSREIDATQLPNRTIAGHDAIGVRMASTTDKGTDVVSLAYLVVANGYPYTVVMTSGVDTESEAEQALDEVFASWTFN